MSCGYCGEPKVTGAHGGFCSDACRNAWWADVAVDVDDKDAPWR